MADGGVYARAGGKWERIGSGGSGGGLDVDATRDDAVLQVKDADGVKSWVEGMALSVVDAVPADTDGEIGDVVFVTGPGDGGSPGVGGGKVLQVVTKADANTHTANTGTWVPTGIDVSITPQSTTSALVVQFSCEASSQKPANSDPISVTLGIFENNDLKKETSLYMTAAPFANAQVPFFIACVIPNTASTPRTFDVRVRVAHNNAIGNITAPKGLPNFLTVTEIEDAVMLP